MWGLVILNLLINFLFQNQIYHTSLLCKTTSEQQQSLLLMTVCWVFRTSIRYSEVPRKNKMLNNVGVNMCKANIVQCHGRTTWPEQWSSTVKFFQLCWGFKCFVIRTLGKTTKNLSVIINITRKVKSLTI